MSRNDLISYLCELTVVFFFLIIFPLFLFSVGMFQHIQHIFGAFLRV